MAELTSADKKKIKAEARKAIDNAWKEETERALKGLQTRDWTDDEYEQLKKGKKVSGYEGHHMQSKNTYPEQAGNPDIIQFLPTPKDPETGKVDRSVHLAAHGGNYQNTTNGYYDEKTGKTKSFKEGEPPSIEQFTKKRNSNTTDAPEGANFMSKNEKGGSKMSGALSGASAGLGAVEEALGLVGALGIDVSGLVDGVQTLQMATQAMSIAQGALNAVMALNPIALVVIAVAALVGGLIYLWNTNEELRNALIAAWDAISAACSAVWDAIVAFFMETIPAAVQFLTDCFNAYLQFWMGVWQSVGEFFSACWDAIVAFFTETIPAAVQAISDKFGEFQTFLAGLWEGIKFAFSAVWDAIVAFFTETLPEVINNMVTWFSELPGKIGEFLNQMVNFFAELPGRIWTFLSDVVSKVVSWCGNLLSTVQGAIPGIVSSITGFFSELPGKMLQIGTNLVQGIWNGISNAAAWVMEKIRGFAGSIIDGIKGIFGIHSPSAIMRDQVGKNLALGVAEGISENADAVSGAMQDMVDAANIEDQSVALAAELTAIPEEEKTVIDYLREMLAESGRELPDGYFTIGGKSAAAFGEGFGSEMERVFTNAMSQAVAFKEKMVATITSGAQYAAARANSIVNNNGNTNTFNNSYSITAQNTSPKATADAIKNQMTMQRMLFAN